MKDLTLRAFGGLLFLTVCLAAGLFIPAGTIHYWQAWVVIALFSGASLVITLYLMKSDPKLLQRRIRAGPSAEKQASQKVIQVLAQIAFYSTLIVPALDYRFGWSRVPMSIVVAGDILVALGFFVVFLVFRENSFASSVIDVEADHKVISSGPYAFVRHPIYIGALIMLVGVPLALGSWWGLLTLVLMSLVVVWRLLDEEEFLVESLPGYVQYRNRVRYRLVPFIW
jgi:protein-S-isoprenylcysteine O-methyltransferase Ste14